MGVVNYSFVPILKNTNKACNTGGSFVVAVYLASRLTTSASLSHLA